MKPFRLPLICLLFALQNPPAAHSGEPPAAVERIAAFGRDLAAKRGPGTYVDCPLSTYRALAMLWAGAKNATADQIALVLKDPGGRDFWADLEAWQEMRRDLSGGTLPVAAQERLWIQAEYPVEAGYADFLGQRGLEAPGSVDFISDPEKAREQINRWAAAATRNQVPTLFPTGAFSGNTRVVLAGTVYFQGRWEEAFDPEQTRTESFRGRSGPAPVPLMHRKGRMVYAEDHGWQIVGLPFDDQGTQLVVALPPEDSPELADRLGTGDPIDAWTAAGQEREVDLFLPRFSISSSLDLSAWLAELGMPDAFSRDRADFSGLNPELYLSGVYQGVSIVVDESGVEAAAGAGAVMDMKGAFAPALPPVVFRADRPFFFCVRDALSGLVYFSGCLADAPGAVAEAAPEPVVLTVLGTNYTARELGGGTDADLDKLAWLAYNQIQGGIMGAFGENWNVQPSEEDLKEYCRRSAPTPVEMNATFDNQYSTSLSEEDIFAGFWEDWRRDADDPLGPMQFAAQQLKDWKINQALFAQYGGRVFVKSDRIPVAYDAARALLAEREAAGDFAIHDASLKDRYLEFERTPPPVALVSEAEGRAALAEHPADRQKRQAIHDMKEYLRRKKNAPDGAAKRPGKSDSGGAGAVLPVPSPAGQPSACLNHAGRTEVAPPDRK